MKKFSLIIAGLMFVSTNIYGQSFKEILKAKKEELKQVKEGFKKNKDYEVPVLDVRDQKEITKKYWSTQEYDMYSGDDNQFRHGTLKLNLEMDSDSNVVAIWFGERQFDKDDKYKPSYISGTEFTYCYSKSSWYVLCFTEKSYISYSVKKAQEGDKDVIMGYVVSGTNFIGGDYIKERDAINYINEQRTYTNTKIDSDREAKIQAEKDRRAKYTLEGKEISQIEAQWTNSPGSEMICGEYYKVGFVVTFKDGSTDKTQNIGGNLYACDFKVDSENGSESSFDSEYSTFGYGEVTVGGSLKATTPKIGAKDIAKFTVSSKYDTGVKLNLSFNTGYPKSLTIHKGGQGGNSPMYDGSDGGRAGHGTPLNVQLTSYNHSETGQKIYIYESYDPWLNTTEYGRFTGDLLTIDVSGGDGADGNGGEDKWSDDYGQPGTGGDGGNGGNGGNMTLIIDPSATGVEVKCYTSAGNGGSGGSGGRCSNCSWGSRGEKGTKGDSGNSGSVDKSIKKVTL